MPLDYQEKLKIFHDEFVNYAWKYIDFQKSLAAGQSVQSYITVTRVQHYFTTKIPILGSFTDWVLEFDSLFDPFKIDLSSSIGEIFSGNSSEVKKTLSMAIQKIAIHIESHLRELNDNNDVSKLATRAATKLIYYLYNNKVLYCTETDIIKGF